MLSASSLTPLAGTFNNNGTTDSTLLLSEFCDPYDICVNPSNNQEIFLTDFCGHRIRKISKATGRVTTILGGDTLYGDQDGPVSSARLSNPSSVIAKNGIIYFADWVAHKVKKIQGGIVTTLAGSSDGDADGLGALASLSYPNRLSFDQNDDLLLCDGGNVKIKRISKAGQVVTIAGGDTAVIRSVFGVCADASGNIYVADKMAQVIHKISRE